MSTRPRTFVYVPGKNGYFSYPLKFPGNKPRFVNYQWPRVVFQFHHFVRPPFSRFAFETRVPWELKAFGKQREKFKIPSKPPYTFFSYIVCRFFARIRTRRRTSGILVRKYLTSEFRFVLPIKNLYTYRRFESKYQTRDK